MFARNATWANATRATMRGFAARASITYVAQTRGADVLRKSFKQDRRWVPQTATLRDIISRHAASLFFASSFPKTYVLFAARDFSARNGPRGKVRGPFDKRVAVECYATGSTKGSALRVHVLKAAYAFRSRESNG